MFSLERIQRIIDLENTVLLYRGTQKMYELLQNADCHLETEKKYLQELRDPQKVRNPQTLESSFKHFTEDLYHDAFINPYNLEKPDNLRHQNTLVDFFRFLKSDSRTPDETTQADEISKRAARLLCLYDCVMQIKKDLPLEETNVFIPYLFERICNCMRDIAESMMCYLAHYRDDSFTVISTSSYAEELMDYFLDDSSFSQVDNCWEQHTCSAEDECAPVGGTVFRTVIYKKSTREEKYRRFPVLALRLIHPWTHKMEPFYLLFQYKDEEGREWEAWEEREEPNCSTLSSEDLNHMRDILFLRSDLVNRIHESLHILVLSQKTCRYVIPLGKPDELTILHLTDLHFTTNDQDYYSSMIENFPQKEPSNGAPYDLVVITGDVVQGRTSAGVLEENYLLADKLLRELACRLWSYDGTRYVRSDWKKRYIIIPGNHDYASMNELEVIPQSGIRSTGTGRPSQTEGGPMVKFAYYIYFINSLLGIDVGEQVRDWLNSTRYYNQMKLNFLCLNTSAGSGPLRNNKVSIDRDFIEKIKNTGHFKDRTTVCLAHHSPKYDPDYVFDRYYVKGVDWNKIKTCVDDFRNILKLNVQTERLEIMEKLTKLDTNMRNAKIGPDKPIMGDFTYYKLNFRNTENERCEAIRSALKRDENMRREDKEKQKNAFNDINKYANVAITLSGHVHVAEAHEGEHCFVGSRLYDREKGIGEYAVLKLYEFNGKTYEKYDWLHYLWKLPEEIANTETAKAEKTESSDTKNIIIQAPQLINDRTTCKGNSTKHPMK